MPISTSALQALREFILARRAAAASAPEQKLMQGFYRGYAGDYDALKAAEQGSGVFYDNPELEPPWVEFHNAMLDRGGASPNIKKFPEWLASNRPEVFSKYEKVFSPDPDRIVQIKGKQNRAPNPEYLPFVQDFVKSREWSDVGDLGNAGLVDLRNMRGVPEHLKSGPRFLTQSEYDDAVRRFIDENGNSPGYAAGGIVTYNPAEIDELASRLMGELEAEEV